MSSHMDESQGETEYPVYSTVESVGDSGTTTPPPLRGLAELHKFMKLEPVKRQQWARDAYNTNGVNPLIAIQKLYSEGKLEKALEAFNTPAPDASKQGAFDLDKANWDPIENPLFFCVGCGNVSDGVRQCEGKSCEGKYNRVQ
jgi:hypothetical protein